MIVDALIPARRGSRRLPGKHGRLLDGRPLLEWTVRAAQGAGCFRRITLSTDDLGLHAQGISWGLAHFPPRPVSLARDSSDSASVLRHYLEWLGQEGVARPEWLMLLQPTSPFRGPGRIREACRLARRGDRDTVSLGPVDKPLAWARHLADGRARAWAVPDPAPSWRLNGAIYLLRVERFLSSGMLMPEDPLALMMEDWESVDIDTPLDWLLAEAVAGWLRERAQSSEEVRP